MEVYTDGACNPNPGPGGWAFWIPSLKIARWGFAGDTTNNRMELMGPIAALEAVPQLITGGADHTEIGGRAITILSDSQYVICGISRHRGRPPWIAGWKKRGWKNQAGQPVMNRDLWERLDAATMRHRVAWQWVRGHNGHVHNERADMHATFASRRQVDGGEGDWPSAL